MTLSEYVKSVGSQEKAAQKLGVSFATLNRWVKGHRRPSPMAVESLRRKGVFIPLSPR